MREIATEKESEIRSLIETSFMHRPETFRLSSQWHD